MLETQWNLTVTSVREPTGKTGAGQNCVVLDVPTGAQINATAVWTQVASSSSPRLLLVIDKDVEDNITLLSGPSPLALAASFNVNDTVSIAVDAPMGETVAVIAQQPVTLRLTLWLPPGTKTPEVHMSSCGYA